MKHEIIRTKYNGVPCEIVHQRLMTRNETVFWLNPDGENLPHWPMAHKTIYGLTEEQWQRIKAQSVIIPKQYDDSDKWAMILIDVVSVVSETAQAEEAVTA